MYKQKLKQIFSPKRLFKSFGYSIKGLIYVFGSEKNMQIHLLAAIFTIICAFLFKISKIEWCITIFLIGFVWVAEAFNTALELLTDLVSPDPHPLAGKAKDVAAGAVLLAAFTAVVVGLIIFLPKFAAFFTS